MNFEIQQPPVALGADISLRSFAAIEAELRHYPQAKRFTAEEQAVITRLIHTTTCFDQVLDHIYFSPDAIRRTQSLLTDGARIIVDVTMIQAGLSRFYLDTYGNEVVCTIHDPEIFAMARQQQTTRSYAAAVAAIRQNQASPIILVCGNAPTFIYAAIRTLIEEKIDPARVALLLFPVGFVNVAESKAYAKKFSAAYDVASIIMEGRFGGSTLGVAALHAIYKLIRDYDGTEHYNGK